MLYVSDGFLGLLGLFFRKIPAGKQDSYARTLQLNPALKNFGYSLFRGTKCLKNDRDQL